jgi:DNA helicase IV
VSGPTPRARAVEAEQAHLDRIQARVEHLRSQAERRLAEISSARLGATFAAQFERDVSAHHQAGRVARYTVGDHEALLFGRLDLSDGDTLPIGRVSVIDHDDVLLVDWRAPAAAPFYRATAAQPEGVARRRTILADGPRVVDVMDELVDAVAAERLGLEATTGEGALLAALERTHVHGMRDIVATIQRDQDRIIRAPATGTMIVTGGPGTGKTVVALHRVAYLLYEDRERYEGRGVLVVGPSRNFTDHTRRVLPSLGEDRVVQRPLEALGPSGLRVVGWDTPDVADVKGDPRMIDVCRRMLAAALPPVPDSVSFTVSGTSASLGRGSLDAIRQRALARIDPARPATRYHARTAAVTDQLVAALRTAWDARRAEHRTATADPSPEQFRDQALESPAVRMLMNAFWPRLVSEEVLGDYARGARPLDDVAGGLLDPGESALVRRSWASAQGWSVEDVALIDELDALLGDPERGVEQREDGTSDVDIEDRWYADFAHVVVDEAQDLSPMQWRAVVRRGPFASWTVVGDLAQRARDTHPRTWQDVATLIGRRHVVIEELATNYRTPTELAPLARRALALAGHDPDGFPTTVRSNGREPVLVVSAEPLGDGLAEALRRIEATDAPAGTIGVVVPVEVLAEVSARLAAGESAGLADDVRVLDARRVKGLEFDDLVVVAPERILLASPLGAHDLYVALTRATRSMHVVTSEPDLPVLDVLDARSG